jgi:transposase-like protein
MRNSPYPEEKVEEALRMYSNGMSMRAILRVLQVPLGTVFT